VAGKEPCHGEAGLAQMHQGLVAALATGFTRVQSLCLVPLAEAAGHAGQVAERLRLLAEVLTASEASGQGNLLAESYRLQGTLLLRQVIPDVAQAEACFQQTWPLPGSCTPKPGSCAPPPA
jgi:hypothetical protein